MSNKKKVLKKIPFIITFAIAILELFLIIINNSNQSFYSKIYTDDICVNVDESYFDSFNIENDTVFFNCVFTVENIGEKKVIEISAKDYQDYVDGLICSENVIGKNSLNLMEDKFVVNSGTNILYVSFIGQHGTNTRKNDRLLPNEIFIKQVQ